MLPGASNIEEFEQKIYNKVDLTAPSSSRDFNHPDIPPYMGFVPYIDKFDAGFFGNYNIAIKFITIKNITYK